MLSALNFYVRYLQVIPRTYRTIEDKQQEKHVSKSELPLKG